MHSGDRASLGPGTSRSRKDPSAPRLSRWRVASRSTAVSAFTIGIGLIAAEPASAERVLLKYETLQALVPDGTSWCAAESTVTVRGQSAADFADNARLQKLLGGLRAALSFECPQAQQVTLVGRAGDAVVYKGTAAAANGWALVADASSPSPPTEPALAVTPTAAATPAAAATATVAPVSTEPAQTAPSSPEAPAATASESAPAADTPTATQTLDTFATPPSSGSTGDSATTFDIPATTPGAAAPGASILASISPREWLLGGIAAGVLAIAIAAFFLMRSRKPATVGPKPAITLEQAIAQQRESSPPRP